MLEKLKSLAVKAFNAGKKGYERAHSAHLSYQHAVDRIDTFNAYRKGRALARGVNREENREAAMSKQLKDSVHNQSIRISRLYNYTHAEEEALEKRLLSKYSAARTKEEAQRVHSSIQAKIAQIANSQGAKKVKSGLVNLNNNMVAAPKIKVKKVVKKTIYHNGKTYVLIGKYDDIRLASQRMQKLRESGRQPTVKNITMPNGKEYLAVYAPKVKPKIKYGAQPRARRGVSVTA